MSLDAHEGYLKYRGKCKEMSEALVAENPDLRLVRGHYWDPWWNREEPHWWCVDADGVIHDPTREQFPSKGVTEFYTEFNGMVACEQCGDAVEEANAVACGNYMTCSNRCAHRLVGL